MNLIPLGFVAIKIGLSASGFAVLLLAALATVPSRGVPKPSRQRRPHAVGDARPVLLVTVTGMRDGKHDAFFGYLGVQTVFVGSEVEALGELPIVCHEATCCFMQDEHELAEFFNVGRMDSFCFLTALVWRRVVRDATRTEHGEEEGDSDRP